MKGLSLEVARDNVTINNLLPEHFDTDRQRHMEGRDGAREHHLQRSASAPGRIESAAAGILLASSFFNVARQKGLLP